MIGHEEIGTGACKVVVMNDWIGDTSSWDDARTYLDGSRFTWSFADLRGYGRSRGRTGAFTVEEAAGDVIELADARAWKTFAIVGHSMSTLVALHLAQNLPDRIDRAVVLTPPPPMGFGADNTRLEAMRSVAHGDDDKRLAALRMMLGTRLSEGFTRLKAERWRAGTDPEAVAGYIAMFARRGLPDPKARITCPLLAITGEHDNELMRSEAVTKFLSPLCDGLVVKPLADCGHYPMQEAPPLLVATIEQFLTASA